MAYSNPNQNISPDKHNRVMALLNQLSPIIDQLVSELKTWDWEIDSDYEADYLYDQIMRKMEDVGFV